MKLPNLSNNKFSYESCYRYPSTKDLKIDNILLKKVNDFSGNFSNPMAKTLKYNSTPKKVDPKEVISPNLNNNQGPVLRNLNDYHIKENFEVDQKRLMKFTAKRKPEFNLISNSKIDYEPLEVIFNKWPRYKEK